MKGKIILLIWLLNPFTILAQDSLLKEKSAVLNLRYTSLYKENSEMSYTSPLGEIGAPSGYVINGRLTTTYMVVASERLPVALAIHPDFTVRVRTDRSAGVRTPSFRLGGTVFWRLSAAEKRYTYAELSFIHHSNGQDGAALLSDGTINTQTGNFNTNYLILAYRFGGFPQRGFPSSSTAMHHKVGVELHKLFNYEPALVDDYGFTRLNYDASFRIYQLYERKAGKFKQAMSGRPSSANTLEKEQWRFNAQLSYAINQLPTYALSALKKRLNMELSANYSFPFMQNVFLMASFGYYGEDPYNIYFKDKYAFMRFGISSTFATYRLKGN